MENRNINLNLNILFGFKHLILKTFVSFVLTIGKYLLNSLKVIWSLIKRKRKWLIRISVVSVLACVCAMGNYLLDDYLYDKACEERLKLLEDQLTDLSKPDSVYKASMIVLSNYYINYNYDKWYGQHDSIQIWPDVYYYGRAIESIKRLAEEGNVKAQVALGIYFEGYSFSGFCHNVWYYDYLEDRRIDKIDYEKSAYWYLEAAKQGNSVAMWRIGLKYKAGKGVKRNIGKALYWIRKSCDYGDCCGALTLGDLYRDGLYEYIKASRYENAYYISKVFIEANIDSAKYYWQLALERGNYEAKERLQRIYE